MTRIAPIFAVANWTTTHSALLYALRQSGCSVLILAPGFKDADYVELLAQVDAPALRRRVVLGEGWDELLANGDDVSWVTRCRRGLRGRRLPPAARARTARRRRAAGRTSSGSPAGERRAPPTARVPQPRRPTCARRSGREAEAPSDLLCRPALRSRRSRQSFRPCGRWVKPERMRGCPSPSAEPAFESCTPATVCSSCRTRGTSDLRGCSSRSGSKRSRRRAPASRGRSASSTRP